QRRVEIEMPPGARILAVGHGLEPGLLLLADDGADFRFLDRLEFGFGNLVRLAHGARIGEPLRTEQTTDMVGSERHPGIGHRNTPLQRQWNSLATMPTWMWARSPFVAQSCAISIYCLRARAIDPLRWIRYFPGHNHKSRNRLRSFFLPS